MSEEAFPGARQESDGHAALRSDLPSQKSEPSADFRKIVSDYFDSNGFLLQDNLGRFEQVLEKLRTRRPLFTAMC